MPSTFAFTFLKLLIVSRKLQISLVHVPLNAPGKNASTTLPFAELLTQRDILAILIDEREIRCLAAYFYRHRLSP